MDLISPGPGMLIWTLFSLVSLVLWTIALISIVKNDFKDSNTKLLWVILVVFLPTLGSILYFIYGKRSRINIS